MSQTPGLFGDDTPTPPPPAPRPAGPFAAVAIERAVDRVLDYSVPKGLVGDLKVGQRVRVPLGTKNRLTYGYVVGISETSDYGKVKPMSAIADDRVLVPAGLMELARWISRYYVAPLGIVLETIIPSAVKSRIGIGYRHIVTPLKTAEEMQTAIEAKGGGKRRVVLSRLLQLQPEETIELPTLAFESDASVVTIRKLAKAGWMKITEVPDLGKIGTPPAELVVQPSHVALNGDQQKAVDDINGRLGAGFSVNLLFGVTGSGKTEVYLRTIQRTVEQGKQAIVLVPEIALTPQTVRRFADRFGDVAVLHSALSQTERHKSWQRISTGAARVIVGARSAIFAPAQNLGLIVVDEEHEPSYKQDQAPRYHGRDVAIKRAQIENVPVVLGSATPSLETWVRSCDACVASSEQPAHPGDAGVAATKKKAYHLVRLPSRVRGLQLPRVEVVDLKQAQKLRKGIHLISPRLESLLKSTLNAGEQAILMLNRRGYANFIYCAHCNEPINCKYCDTTMTYHRVASMNPRSASTEAGLHTGQMHCHYCLAVNPLPQTCPTCGKKLALFGLGTQRVEEELERKFPGVNFARADSDAMRSRTDYEKLLESFGKGEIQILLGTQMIAKGLDYPNVTLVGVISGDTALSLPDFRAGERTFQLITQVAGRAGRGDKPGRVVLQSFMPEDASLQAAIRQDFEGFAEHELAQRREAKLPPFQRMVRIVLRDDSQQALVERGEELAVMVADAVPNAGAPIDVRGPMPCPIERIAGFHRQQIVLTAPSAAALQRVLARLRTKHKLVSNDRVAIDVDPLSML